MSVPMWALGLSSTPTSDAPKWIRDFFADMHANPAWVRDIFPLSPTPEHTKSLAYVCLDDGGMLPLAYDTGSWTTGTEVTTGGSLCFSCDFSPDGQSGLAAYRAEGVRPFTVDPNTKKPTFGSVVAAGTGPTVVRIAPSGDRALVAGWEGNTVADLRLSGGAWTNHATITTLYNQYGLAIAPDGNSALVPSYDSSAISQLHWSGTSWIVGSEITTAVSGIRGVTIASNGLTALVSHASGVLVLSYSGGEWSSAYSLTFGFNAFNSAIAPNGKTAIVALEASNTISILSCTSGTWSYAYDVHHFLVNVSDVAITSDGKSAIVTALSYSNVYQLYFDGSVWSGVGNIATPGSSSGVRICSLD